MAEALKFMKTLIIDKRTQFVFIGAHLNKVKKSNYLKF